MNLDSTLNWWLYFEDHSCLIIKRLNPALLIHHVVCFDLRQETNRCPNPSLIEPPLQLSFLRVVKSSSWVLRRHCVVLGLAWVSPRLMPSSFSTHLDRILMWWQELCGHVQSVLTRPRAERRTCLINFPSGFLRAAENTSHSRSGGDLVPPRFMRPLNPKTSARRCDLRLVAA